MEGTTVKNSKKWTRGEVVFVIGIEKIGRFEFWKSPQNLTPHRRFNITVNFGSLQNKKGEYLS